MKNSIDSTYYLVQVIGTIWQGLQGSYTYRVHDAPAVFDEAAVKRLAGDFRYVEDYQVIRVTESTLTPRPGVRTRCITEDVVRPWRTEESEDTFNACQAGAL